MVTRGKGASIPMNFFARMADGPAVAPISPYRELGAYEALWLEPSATFKTIADRFAAEPTALPSDFVPPKIAEGCAEEVMTTIHRAGIKSFGVRIHHAGQYPKKLRDARHPVELLYYRGTWELTETRCIAVVGSRKPSPEGVRRAKQVSRDLVRAGFTIVSGLATGIDTAAHTAAIEEGGETITVVGTPLGQVYPRENADLQERIARDYLLITQVPVLRYGKQAPPQNRLFFPERNVTMSALTEATIIVEAGETSGTLIQARAALHQGRKLFIMNSAFERAGLTWPARYEAQGAIRVRSTDDILRNL
jgi:DNA processing protein